MSRRISCPVCGRGPRDKTCVVFSDGKVHCHRCAQSVGPDHWKAIKDALGEDSPQPVVFHHYPEESYRVLQDWGWKIWHESRPISGAAAAYLRARHCRIPPEDGDLRWHPELKGGEHVGPALVGLVTDFRNNEAISLHRTWIHPDGRKAGPGRLFLRGHTTKHGVVRLWPDEHVERGLFLSEGIETGLAAAADGWVPVWAALSASTLRGLPVLKGIETLTIIADKDTNGVGECAALACENRWRAAGVDVEVYATHGFGDYADERARRARHE